MKALDPIVVTRNVPAIHILLSLDDIDTKTPGYQLANQPTSFWPGKETKRDEDYAYKHKRNFSSSNKKGHRQQSQNQNGNNQENRKQKKPEFMKNTAGTSAQP